MCMALSLHDHCSVTKEVILRRLWQWKGAIVYHANADLLGNLCKIHEPFCCGILFEVSPKKYGSFNIEYFWKQLRYTIFFVFPSYVNQSILFFVNTKQ